MLLHHRSVLPYQYGHKRAGSIWVSCGRSLFIFSIMRSLTFYSTCISLVAGLLDAFDTPNADQTISHFQNASTSRLNDPIKKPFSVQAIDKCPPPQYVVPAMYPNATQFVESHRLDDPREFSGLSTPRNWSITCRTPSKGDKESVLKVARGSCGEDELCFNGRLNTKAFCVSGARNYFLHDDGTSRIHRRRIYAPIPHIRRSHVEVILTQSTDPHRISYPSKFYEAKAIEIEARSRSGVKLKSSSFKYHTHSLQMVVKRRRGWYIDVAVELLSPLDQPTMYAFFGGQLS